MIKGIGIDIVELSRIRKAVDRNERFVKRILTEKELNQFKNYAAHRQVEFLAGRFAAKEAFTKAVGTGISKTYGWHDIEILNQSNGKPELKYDGNDKVHLSISHSREYVVAQIVIESLSS